MQGVRTRWGKARNLGSHVPLTLSLPGARSTGKQPRTVIARILEGTHGTVGSEVLGAGWD